MTAFKCGAQVLFALIKRFQIAFDVSRRQLNEITVMRDTSQTFECIPIVGVMISCWMMARRYDVIVAADCVYYPPVHDVLLKSIRMLMADDGITLLPFALHGNTVTTMSGALLRRRKAMGFVVEQLESAQLSPQIKTMDSKRGLVHMLRLTRSKR